MAEEDKDVNVRFGANISDLQDKLKEVGGLFGLITDKFAALAAVLAGGAAFKSFIDEANQVNVQAERMARVLGVTAGEAGILAVALDDIGASMGANVSPDTYTSAFLKFNRALKSNSEELKSLGVDVDALANGQKTSNEVFLEALAIPAKYKAGIDQTQVSMKLFGKSVEDVQALMQLNDKALEDARASAQALNLTITQEGVAAANRYRVAMDNVGDVLQGMRKTLGEAVMPLFSAMAESMSELGPAVVQVTQLAIQTFTKAWSELGIVVSTIWSAVKDILGQMASLWRKVFGEDGPDAMRVFVNSLNLVQAAFVGLRIGVELIATFVRTMLDGLVSNFQTLAEVGANALDLNWEGVKASWSEGVARTSRILREGMAEMVKTANKGRDDIEEALMRTSEVKRGKEAGASGTSGDKAASLGADEANATAKLSLLRVINEGALKLEMEYLRQAEALLERDYKNGLLSTKDYYQDKLSIEQAGIDRLIEAKKREAGEASQSKSGATKEAQRLQFAAQEQKLLFEINELEAKRNGAIQRNAAEYEEAEQRRMDVLAQIAANRALDTANAEVAATRSGIDAMRDLRQIDADEAFARQRQQEQQSITALRRYYEEKQLLIRGNAEKQASLDAEREAAERAHQQRLVEIDRAAVLERAQLTLQVQQSVQGGFASMLNELMSGTVKLKDAVRNFAFSVATSFQNLIAQRFAEKLFGSGTAGGGFIDSLTQPIIGAVDTIVKKWILGQTTMAAASEASAATRVATEEGAASQSLLIMAGTAIKGIAIAAWEAAANVYKSIAAIPYVGPFLAPAAAIAAGAVVMGFAKNISSAEGGWWQIPGDQIAQVHKNEMVLPAPEAQGIRDIVSGGKRVGGGDTYNINAVDAPSVKRLFMENSGALVDVLKSAKRDQRK